MNTKDYTFYKLTKKEYFIYGILGFSAFILLSYLFYHTLIPSLLFFIFIKKYYNQVQIFLTDKMCEQLSAQFKDSLVAISASLEAGCSLENAIWDAYLEICILYSNSCYMAKELYSIYNQLRVNVPVEMAFSNLAARTNLDDIKTFCQILKVAKRTDGNITEIITSTAKTIEDKFNIKREAKTNINGKKLEQFVMLAMPFFIIFYINLSSPGFFDMLYFNFTGVFISTICLLLYIASIAISLKITRIEV